MYLVYDILYPQEARENADRWLAGRRERLRWLHDQLGIDPESASLTGLWSRVVSWQLDGNGTATTADCPVWWNDEYDLDDMIVMADALAHPFCDEALRREPAIRLKLHNSPGHHRHNQLTMKLGRWALPPWTVPHVCMEHLRPDAKPQLRLASVAADYLESAMQDLITALEPWKQELANKKQRR